MELPYILKVSTWQELVKAFDAQRLVKAVRCALDDTYVLAAAKLGDSIPNKVLIQTIRPMLQELVDCCRSADLLVSIPSLERSTAFCDSALRTELISENLVDSVRRSLIVVEDELAVRSFFSLEPKEADRFNKPWFGWEAILARFGNTARDIEEMNKCFSLCRYTASMFHALQVAEWGAIELGDYIGVIDPKKGWGPTKKRLAEIVKGGHANLPANLSNKWDFIEQMNREIDSMTLAWRHKVDHAANHLAIVPNTDFTPDIAEHIIGAVRVFMLRLTEGML